MLDKTKVELPYSFELCFDIKRLSELEDKLQKFAELLEVIEAHKDSFAKHQLDFNFVRVETKDLQNV